MRQPGGLVGGVVGETGGGEGLGRVAQRVMPAEQCFELLAERGEVVPLEAP